MRESVTESLQMCQKVASCELSRRRTPFLSVGGNHIRKNLDDVHCAAICRVLVLSKRKRERGERKKGKGEGDEACCCRHELRSRTVHQVRSFFSCFVRCERQLSLGQTIFCFCFLLPTQSCLPMECPCRSQGQHRKRSACEKYQFTMSLLSAAWRKVHRWQHGSHSFHCLISSPKESP